MPETAGVSLPTGLAYSPAFTRHHTGSGHPERPERVEAIVAHLQASGLWDRLDTWEPALTSESVVEYVHTPGHVNLIRQFAAAGRQVQIDADTAFSPHTWEAALRAAGACVEAADRVSSGALANAYCVVRPPGHHATPSQAMGFCIFNNVAIAAEWLLRNRRAERVAILDYDVHHGNGTQDAFFERSDVLYVSTHQFPFYPGTGHWREHGAGAGEGCTVNISLPAQSGDLVYTEARVCIIEPVVRRYRPDFILVSLGFDAFWDDPLAIIGLSIRDGYVPLIRSAKALADELCGGKLVLALEGGYNLDALALGSESVCRVLLGEEPPQDTLGPAPFQLPVSTVQPLLEQMGTLHRV